MAVFRDVVARCAPCRSLTFAAAVVGVGVSSFLTGGVAADVLHAAVGMSAAAAVGAGMSLNRPRPLRPWLLVGSSVLLFACGDVAYCVPAGASSTLVFNPGDWLYLAASLLMLAALTSVGGGLTRSARATRLLFTDAAM